LSSVPSIPVRMTTNCSWRAGRRIRIEGGTAVARPYEVDLW
jgi:hypothetical protein